jgi:hypothetical protein
MVGKPDARGGNPINTPARARRVLAEEAVAALSLADDEELIADLEELSAEEEKEEEEKEEKEEEEKEEEEQEQEQEEEAPPAAAARAKRPHTYLGWCQAKDLFLSAVVKRGTYLEAGLVAAGNTEAAARAGRMVVEAKALRVVIAAYPKNFHPPAAVRRSGRRRLRTCVGATVFLREDVQAQLAKIYPTPGLLAAPCRVTERDGKWLKVLLADGQSLALRCNRIVAPRTTAAATPAAVVEPAAEAPPARE